MLSWQVQQTSWKGRARRKHSEAKKKAKCQFPTRGLPHQWRLRGPEGAQGIEPLHYPPPSLAWDSGCFCGCNPVAGVSGRGKSGHYTREPSWFCPQMGTLFYWGEKQLDSTLKRLQLRASAWGLAVCRHLGCFSILKLIMIIFSQRLGCLQSYPDRFAM